VVASSADLDPEERILAQMRLALDADPNDLLQLDDNASREFPNGARAAERGYLRVRALVKLDRIGDARAAAESLIERYPTDPDARKAAAFMGVHPRPKPPVPIP